MYAKPQNKSQKKQKHIVQTSVKFANRSAVSLDCVYMLSGVCVCVCVCVCECGRVLNAFRCVCVCVCECGRVLNAFRCVCVCVCLCMHMSPPPIKSPSLPLYREKKKCHHTIPYFSQPLDSERS